MKTRKPFKFIGLVAALIVSVTTAQAAPMKSDSLAGGGGVIRITPIFHASTQIDYRGKVILVDPVAAGTYHKKADLILITHTHPDHFDPATIAKVRKAETVVVVPADAAAPLKEKHIAFTVLTSLPESKRYIGSFDAGKILPNASVQAVPAYNTVRGPKAGQFFHPRGQFNGYVLTLGSKRLYFAGDTENIPEMKKLKNIYAAFLPMNLPFTMTPQEAAAAARGFKPKIVYPYHFRYPFSKANDNPQQFAKALKGSGIQVRILDFYPAAAIKKAMKAAG